MLQFISGFAKAMFLFLIASGLSLIWGVSKVLNLTHGSLYMLGAYLVFSLLHRLPLNPGYFLIAIVAASILVALIGGVIEMVLLRRLYRAEEFYIILMTIALIFIIDDVVRWIWGPYFLSVAKPTFLAGSWSIWGHSFPTYYIPILTAGPMIAIGLWFLVYRTRWGLLVRAAAMDREMLEALGVDVPRVCTLTFMLGCGLAGMSGALAAAVVTLEPAMDATVIIEAIAVVVIGGLGSLPGTLVAALLVGILESFAILIFPSISLVLVFAIMTLIIIIHPAGLLGIPE